MATYWHQHPRNFANECTILRADTLEQAARLESLGFERLTRDQARRHIRWVNGENTAWGSNRAVGSMDFRALTDSAHDAHWSYSATHYLGEMDMYNAEAAAILADEANYA